MPKIHISETFDRTDLATDMVQKKLSNDSIKLTIELDYDHFVKFLEQQKSNISYLVDEAFMPKDSELVLNPKFIELFEKDVVDSFKSNFNMDPDSGYWEWGDHQSFYETEFAQNIRDTHDALHEKNAVEQQKMMDSIVNRDREMIEELMKKYQISKMPDGQFIHISKKNAGEARRILLKAGIAIRGE